MTNLENDIHQLFEHAQNKDISIKMDVVPNTNLFRVILIKDEVVTDIQAPTLLKVIHAALYNSGAWKL